MKKPKINVQKLNLLMEHELVLFQQNIPNIVYHNQYFLMTNNHIIDYETLKTLKKVCNKIIIKQKVKIYYKKKLFCNNKINNIKSI